MAKYNLNLHRNYVKDWGIAQAIREIMQNAIDSDAEGNPMLVEHKGNKLTVTNIGAKLDHSVFLLGKTSKEGRDDQAGKFGEGLKLALLILARENIKCRIVNGDESWIPEMEPSDLYGGERVLVVNTRKLSSQTTAFSIEVEFPREEWENQKWRYLAVSKRPAKDVIQTTRGKVLLGEEDKGRIFVKGIYVCRVPELEYGYDLKDARLDRDRNFIHNYDLKEKVKPMLEEALSQQRMSSELIWDMMSREAPEVSVSIYDTPNKTLEQIAVEGFERKFGDKAHPVLNMEQAAELEHLGIRGVIVSSTIVNATAAKYGSIERVKEKLKGKVSKVYQLDELGESRLACLRWALDTLGQVTEVGMADVLIADFVDARLAGLYENGSIKLASSLLDDRADTLATLVHEVAHRKGADGSKSHVAEIERLWTELFRRLGKEFANP